MILQRNRGAEQRHHPVAGVLHCPAAVALDNRRQPLHELGHDFAQPLHIQRGRDIHRAHHIGEQHRHLLVLRCVDRNRAWRTALVTELGILPQRVPQDPHATPAVIRAPPISGYPHPRSAPSPSRCVLRSQRFRHRAIATHQVPVGDVVAAGPREQRAQPQQRDLEDRRTFVGRRFANRSIAGWASARSPSAPRSAASPPETGAPNAARRSRPRLMHTVDGFTHQRNGSVAVAAPGLLPREPHVEKSEPLRTNPCRNNMSRTSRQELQSAVTVRTRCRDAAARHPASPGRSPGPYRHWILRQSAPPPRSCARWIIGQKHPERIPANRRSRRQPGVGQGVGAAGHRDGVV